MSFTEEELRTAKAVEEGIEYIVDVALTAEIETASGRSATKNAVDMLNELVSATNNVANAITPADAVSGKDATGGTVTSLTEAVMGMTAGLVKIADAIESLANAVSEISSK